MGFLSREEEIYKQSLSALYILHYRSQGIYDNIKTVTAMDSKTLYNLLLQDMVYSSYKQARMNGWKHPNMNVIIRKCKESLLCKLQCEIAITLGNKEGIPQEIWGIDVDTEEMLKDCSMIEKFAQNLHNYVDVKNDIIRDYYTSEYTQAMLDIDELKSSINNEARSILTQFHDKSAIYVPMSRKHIKSFHKMCVKRYDKEKLRSDHTVFHTGVSDHVMTGNFVCEASSISTLEGGKVLWQGEQQCNNIQVLSYKQTVQTTSLETEIIQPVSHSLLLDRNHTNDEILDTRTEMEALNTQKTELMLGQEMGAYNALYGNEEESHYL